MAAKQICPDCAFIGQPKTITKGNILVEAVLWLCLLVPGFVYSLWRLTTRHMGCPQCGAEHMVPLNSPHGKKLRRELR
jgi:hypothetical protein